MLQIFKCTPLPSLPALACRAAAVAMLSAMAACGGGSDETATGGTRISAATKAASGAKEKPEVPDAASEKAHRATPFHPMVNSLNPAMQKLARLQCIKRARISPGEDKVRFPAATTQDLKQDNCAEIMAVQQG